MKLPRHLLAPVFVALAGCSASGGSSEDPFSAGSAGAPSNLTAGCSRTPACASCTTCIDRCFCEHQDTAFCANQCTTMGPAPQPSAMPSTTPSSVPMPTAVPSTGPVPSSSPSSVPTGTGAPDATPPPPPPPPPVRPSVTVTSAQFPIPPGGELFKCQNFRNPLGKDIAIVESESFMAPGSHHMFLFREPAVVADTNGVEDCSGVEFRDYVHLSQQPQIKWTYPSGVARLLKSNDGLRIAVHYMNATSSPLTGQVSVTLSYVEPSEVKFLAAPIFLQQTLLAVPPGPSTASRQFAVPYSIQMIRAVGHMHSRGKLFNAVTNSGQSVYDTTDWEEPAERIFDPPLTIAGGSTITWSCTYENPTGTTFMFGESATMNEMCIMYGLFYPTDPNANQGVSLGGLI